MLAGNFAANAGIDYGSFASHFEPTVAPQGATVKLVATATQDPRAEGTSRHQFWISFDDTVLRFVSHQDGGQCQQHPASSDPPYHITAGLDCDETLTSALTKTDTFYFQVLANAPVGTTSLFSEAVYGKTQADSPVANLQVQGGAGSGPVRDFTYVALGDSYSSGEGNAPFDTGTPAPCDRSTNNAWPRLAGKKNHIARTVLFACSGATSKAIDSRYLGQNPQITDLRSAQADVVTMTFGGNDIGFAPVLEFCYFFDVIHFRTACSGRLDLVDYTIRQKMPEWTQRFAEVQRAVTVAKPSARVYVVGYPRLFPVSQSAVRNCDWLSSDQREKLNALDATLNSALAQAARASGATFISTDDVLAGHELCTAQSWVNRIVPDANAQNQRADGHPFGPGQQAMADRVAGQI